jgi:hypothetical protein
MHDATQMRRRMRPKVNIGIPSQPVPYFLDVGYRAFADDAHQEIRSHVVTRGKR